MAFMVEERIWWLSRSNLRLKAILKKGDCICFGLCIIDVESNQLKSLKSITYTKWQINSFGDYEGKEERMELFFLDTFSYV